MDQARIGSGQMPVNIGLKANMAQGEAGARSSGSALSSAPDSSQDITDIARKLAAHGGGAASLDLAFDLVLHGIVEQARTASGATGAAIALNRDGKMVCRATTGENAPDLGVSVDAASGLTGICLKTGTVQHCMDIESDPGIDAETCRRLGVRSMLLIPLIDANLAFGVLQLFSSSANAFGGHDMETLLRLADRVAENRRVMLQSEKFAGTPDCVQTSLTDQLRPTRSDCEATVNKDVFQADSRVGKTNEPLTAVLFFLVIIAAVSLGMVVGWSHGRRAATTPRVSAQLNPISAERDRLGMKPSPQDQTSGSTGSLNLPSSFHNGAKSADSPVGGLVVTDNGKVIYRSAEDPAKPSPKQFVSQRSTRELIHRVEPEYPQEARAQHIAGMVVLDLDIAEDGSIANAAIVSGDPLLASAAVQAARQWQYQPEPGGSSRARVTLRFTLPVN